MSKLLSIIIPSYNMERYLRKCLCSACIEDENLLDMLEVLVVNDGSTDETSAIAHEFANLHPSVFHVIDKVNGHYGSCINRGLLDARGTFVRLLDADDYLDTNGLKTLLTFLQGINDPHCGIDAVLTDYQCITSKHKIVSSVTPPFNHNTEITLEEFATNPYDRQMPAITYRRSIFDKLNYKQTEGIAYTDTEWIFLPMTRVRKLTYLNALVYNYRIDREGQSMAPNVFIRQLDMLHQTLQTKINEYTARKSEWSTPAKDYADSQLAREIANLFFNCLKASNSRILSDLDELLNHELQEIKHKVGFDGALFVNPFIKFLFAKGCCQHHFLRPLMRCLINCVLK